MAACCTQMEVHTFSNAVRCAGVCKNQQEALFMASAEQNRFTYFLRRFKCLGMSRIESNIMKPVLFTALYPGNFYVWTKCIMLSPRLVFGLCSWKSQQRAKQHGMGQIRIKKQLRFSQHWCWGFRTSGLSSVAGLSIHVILKEGTAFIFKS